MSDPITEQAEAYMRGTVAENPYPRDSFAHAVLELNRAKWMLSDQLAKALGIYWLLDKLAGILKR
jgi:hypothetical protein